MSLQPTHHLFVQHGWNDDHTNLQQLAAHLASSDMQVFTPNLGLLRTWLGIDPLIVSLEAYLARVRRFHPSIRIRIVGHSLGGLIWLELLSKHRDIWIDIDSLVLIGSPVGGSDLARIVDPFGLLPTIARDLGKSRRDLAEEIARNIPVLVVAGDRDHGSDTVITVGSTYVEGATNIRLPGVGHNALRTPQAVASAIQQFWGDDPQITLPYQLRHRLLAVPGITDAHERDFARARIRMRFHDGTTIRMWKNPVGVDHVFVADAADRLYFGGFVGWIHAASLQKCLAQIKDDFRASLVSIQ